MATNWRVLTCRGETSSLPTGLQGLKKENDLPSSSWTDYIQTACSVLGPEKPENASFEGMIKVLLEHYSPKPSGIVSRFKFLGILENPLVLETC